MATRNTPYQTEPEMPRVERYAGHNNPYRGTEEHGVAPTEEWSDVPRHATEAAVFLPPDEEQAPIPVKVVTESGSERVLWRGQSVPVGDTPTRVAGGHEKRRNLQIRNDGPNAVFLGSQGSDANPITGYKLPSGQSVTLANTHDDVWAIAAAAVAAGANAPNHSVSFGTPGAITASGTGGTVDLAAFGTDVSGIVVTVVVTALGVGPGQTADLVLQESEDGANWQDVAARTVTAVGTWRMAFSGPMARYLRVIWRGVAGGGVTVGELRARVQTYGESAAGNAAIPQSAVLHVITEYAVDI